MMEQMTGRMKDDRNWTDERDDKKWQNVNVRLHPLQFIQDGQIGLIYDTQMWFTLTPVTKNIRAVMVIDVNAHDIDLTYASTTFTIAGKMFWQH